MVGDGGRASYGWRSDDWEDYKEAGMEFRLVYQGPLKATTPNDTRAGHKHEIRKVFHHQLREVWQIQRPLPDIAAVPMGLPPNAPTGLEKLASQFARCGYRFAPLINRSYGWVCDLDILLLRREEPGAIIRSGGDTIVSRPYSMRCGCQNTVKK